MTNGERIRQMTDDELSKFLDSFEDDLKEDLRKEHCNICKRDNLKVCEQETAVEDCGINAIKEWLIKEC